MSDADRRKGEKMKRAGIKVAAMGLVIVVLPWFMGRSVLAGLLSSLSTVGLLGIAVGAAMAANGHHILGGRIALPRVPIRMPTPEPQGVARPQFFAGSPPSTSKNNALTIMQPTAWGTDVLDVIEWRRFEAVVELLFQQAGFETRSQPHGADGGVDLWLHSRHHCSEPDQPVSLVQCKHWRGRRVGVDKVRELRGVMASRNVQRGQFVTSSTFTSDAIDFAHDNGIRLLDGEGLLELIESRTAEQQASLLQVALEGEYWRPTCASCGIKMVTREPKRGGKKFWGCRNYPGCKSTLPMRGGDGAVG